jgi:hypothetical protein
MNLVDTILGMAKKPEPPAPEPAAPARHGSQRGEPADIGKTVIGPRGSSKVINTAKSPEPKPGMEFGYVPFSPRFLSWVSKQSAGPLVTKEELAFLKAKAEAYDKLVEAVEVISHQKAKEAAMQAAKQLATGIASGTIPPDAGDAWSRADFVSDYEQRRKSLRQELRLIAGECVPVLRTVIERLAQTAERMAVEREKAERADYETAGFAFKPSMILCGLHQLTWRSKDVLPDCPGSPRSVLKSIGFAL